jgi:hypothetical protein
MPRPRPARITLWWKLRRGSCVELRDAAGGRGLGDDQLAVLELGNH